MLQCAAQPFGRCQAQFAKVVAVAATAAPSGATHDHGSTEGDQHGSDVPDNSLENSWPTVLVLPNPAVGGRPPEEQARLLGTMGTLLSMNTQSGK
jgi:hypothetical protein